MNKNKSFTLIELLVVIVIIGILAGVIMISTSSSIDKANFAKAQAFSSTVQNELLSNLVSEWTFDSDAVSNKTEDTWGNNDGTVYGAQYKDSRTGECVFGGCYSFDGQDDYIKITDNSDFDFENQMSAFVWVKGTNQSVKYILTQWDAAASKRQWSIGTDPGNGSKLRVMISSDGTFTNAKIYITLDDVFNNSWHYVGFTWNNAGILKLYLDGATVNVTKSTNITFTSFYTADTNAVIGAYLDNNAPNGFFKGLIDDVRVYNAALSSSQIKQNYIAGLNSMLANENISKEDYNERINTLAYKQE